MYTINRASEPISSAAAWDSAAWSNAEELPLEVRFDHPKTKFFPDVRVKMLYDDTNLYGIFQVKDQCVRAVAKADQEQVCRDSCVEFFVRPGNQPKYFNFEMNCGGTLLLYCVSNLRGTGDYIVVPAEDLATVGRVGSMPRIVDPEITEPTTWTLSFRIPVALFEKYVGPLGKLAGSTWHANFTNCADQTSNPHWLSWMPLSRLDFHLPDEFGEIYFA